MIGRRFATRESVFGNPRPNQSLNLFALRSRSRLTGSGSGVSWYTTSSSCVSQICAGRPKTRQLGPSMQTPLLMYPKRNTDRDADTTVSLRTACLTALKPCMIHRMPVQKWVFLQLREAPHENIVASTVKVTVPARLFPPQRGQILALFFFMMSSGFGNLPESIPKSAHRL
jgi:hypothetical protein